MQTFCRLRRGIDIMQKNLESSDKSAYTKFHFKRKLIENYSDELVISNEDGKPDIATLTILRKYYEAPKDIGIDLQKILLLTAAATFIKADIKLIYTDPKCYPSLETLEQSAALSFLPSSLLLFLYNIIVPGNELKLAAIGQLTLFT